MIKKLVDGAGDSLHLVWVDDRFLMSNSDAQELGPRFGEEDAVALDESFLTFALDDAGRKAEDRAPPLHVKTHEVFRQIIRSFVEVCTSFNIRLSVTNFRYLNKNSTEMNDANTFFLLDIKNLDVSDPEDFEKEWEKDPRGLSDVYGAYFARHWKIPPSRFRFLSRYMGHEQLEKTVTILEMPFDEVQSHHFPVNEEAARKALKKWLGERLLHDDPVVSESLTFYRSPWVARIGTEMNAAWPGKWNSGSAHDNTFFGRQLAKWIDAEARLKWQRGWEEEASIGEELKDASKCLFIWRSDGTMFGKWWTAEDGLMDANRGGYVITGRILQLVLDKLGFRSVGLVPGGKYVLPVEPALPFLLSLRLFARKMNDNSEIAWYQSPDSNNVQTYRLSIPTKRRSWALRDAFQRLGGRDEVTTTLLRNALRARVAGIRGAPPRTGQDGRTLSDENEWKRLFTGLEYDICGVFFRPASVDFMWTATSVGGSK